jgi:hypothetical protein
MAASGRRGCLTQAIRSLELVSVELSRSSWSYISGSIAPERSAVEPIAREQLTCSDCLDYHLDSNVLGYQLKPSADVNRNT